MNISAKVEYACLAMLELALRSGTGEPVRVREVAEAHQIPPQFLTQILLQLKGAGLVNSTRGAAGGYQLARDPEQITLAEVIGVMEGRLGEREGGARGAGAKRRVLFEVWEEAARAQTQLLEAVTFAELASRLRGRTEDMYYI